MFCISSYKKITAATTTASVVEIIEHGEGFVVRYLVIVVIGMKHIIVVILFSPCYYKSGDIS